MDLVSYLKSKLTDKTGYEWSLDVSWSGSVYINYVYGTEEKEDDGYNVRTSIRFSDHNRPPVVNNGGVFDHSYLKDFRVNNGIEKGFVDAVLEYADTLVIIAKKELDEDTFICISWSNEKFQEIKDRLIENNNYSTELLTLDV